MLSNNPRKIHYVTLMHLRYLIKNTPQQYILHRKFAGLTLQPRHLIHPMIFATQYMVLEQQYITKILAERKEKKYFSYNNVSISYLLGRSLA